MKTLFSFIALSCAFTANAQQLFTDSLFGVNGFATYATPAAPICTEIIDLQNDYFLIGGYNYTSAANDYKIDIVRADYCGAIDSTFGVNGLVNHTFSQRNLAFDFQLQDDGRILSCGIESTSNAGSGQIPYVSRFNIDGSPDTTFGTMGSNSLRFDPISSGRFFGVRQMSDGRVACAGYSTGNINGGTPGFGAMRFTATGVLDSTFDGDGIVRHSTSVSNGLGAGFITSDNDVIGVGGWVDNSFLSHFMVTSWDSTGALNLAYGYGGFFMDSVLSINNDIYAVRDSNGYITMAADVNPGPSSILLLRLTPSGFPDPTFGVDGYALIVNASIGTVSGIQLMPNGKYLVMGGTVVGGGFCTMLEIDGSTDLQFGNLGFLLTPVTSAGYGNPRGMIELPNGQWVLAGGGTELNATRLTTISNIPHITQQFNYLSTTGTGTFQWFLNDTLMNGAITDTLNFTQNGSYTVQLAADYGCTYLSDPYVVTNTGLAETMHGTVSMFPNPVGDELQIHNSTEIEIRITIYSVEGKEVVSLLIPLGIYHLNCAKLSTGMYFVKTEDGRVMKFVKE